MHERIASQISLKEREINNANDRLKTAKKELKSLKKKSQLTQGDKLVTLQEKIMKTTEQNKELERELRLLKRQQKLQGNELVKLQNTDDYPTKIRQLMEDVRFAREKQMDQSERIGNEKASIARQKERVFNLQKLLEPYEDIDVAKELANLTEKNQREADENDELVQRVLELENEQAAKA